MICESFLECGGCQIPQEYDVQFRQKLQNFIALFGLQENDVEKFLSPHSGFRARAEFRLGTEDDKFHLCMNAYGQNHRVKITSCPIILPSLQDKLQKLLVHINTNEIISHKLYGIKVLGTLSQESLITLIYHRQLDEKWAENIAQIAQNLQCSIIGRSRGKKTTITQDFVTEILPINSEKYSYIQEEGRFSQPNPYVNIQMIEFVLSKLPSKLDSDLLELYCGSGNFTLPLAKRFGKILCTEIVKSAIKTLEKNIQNNQIKNIIPVRLSGSESIEALSRKRAFFRLKEIDLDSFDFSHILIDPPRSGIGDTNMLEFITSFKSIIYISCNPLSLKEDLKILQKTHKIAHCGVFDQFPYTHHLECAMILQKI